MPLPSDSNSLLVPVFLNAWVNDQNVNPSVLARYNIDYTNLSAFTDPIPAPFSAITAPAPANGIYLKWALPDALTHAEHINGNLAFPDVPNRWVLVRFTPGNDQWSMTAWVIQSDYINANDGAVSFLDPNPANPSGINSGNNQVTLNQTLIGKSYNIEQWTATKDAPLFLKAAGPGNIAFAAFQPFCDNVFSFADTDLPATGVFNYSYMVVGWYSDPASDPLAGATTPDLFNTLLREFQWSLPGEQPFPASPPLPLPVSSLYHGFIADVPWPPCTQAFTPPPVVDVAVGNSAADALAALIHNSASRQGKSSPGDKDQWITAGNTLCELIQAAMLQLLDDYGQPGGQQLVDQQVENSWFGADPGGTIWQVAPDTAQKSGFNIAADNLTPAQNKALVDQLAALNTAQQNYDVQQRKLQSLQSQLYMTWLTVVQANTIFKGMGEPATKPFWPTILEPALINNLYPDIFYEVWQLYCAQGTTLSLLPDPTNVDAATKWANTNWTFPSNDSPPKTVTLSDLNLKLKGAAAPAFKHPVDPVVMLSASGRSFINGEDGIYNKDGTLTVRLGGQTISGLSATGLPQVTAAAVAATNIVFDAFSAITTIPSISNLLTEAFFCDPLNGSLMETAVPGTDAPTLKQCIIDLLDQNINNGTWMGTVPSPVAYSLWTQAWSPLWMEWIVNYYPTTTGTNSDFDMGSWTFDGKEYILTDVTTILEQPIEFTGRTSVSPFAQTVFKTAIENYLKDHPEIDGTILDQLICDVMSWDLLSQSLTGVTDGLITKLAQTTFPPPKTPVTSPPASAPTSVTCPAPLSPPSSPPSSLPLVGDLVEGQYNLLPQLENSDTWNIFFPVRGAMVTFGSLQVVDAFGQIIDLMAAPNIGPQGFQPLISPSLTPPADIQIPSFLNAPFLLGPRLAQSSRLNLNFLANDGSGNLVTSQNDNPICGWLLPNHLDNSLDVYDDGGQLLGELLQLPAPNNWRPGPGKNPPAPTPEDISNTALKNVVVTLAKQKTDVFGNFMKVIDETLWMSDPLGGRSDTFISALIGRPLAVTEMAVSLELNGVTATSQLFDDMLTHDSTLENFTPVHNTGAVENISFSVRLGSLQLPGDGLMGYFLNAEVNVKNVFPNFYSVHIDPGNDKFIIPVVDNSAKSPVYRGKLTVKVNAYTVPEPPAEQVKVTMILDPLGVVHGYTGILPVATAALPPYEVQNFLKKMLVNFQTGPVLADPGTLRTPQPAEKQGTWDWLQHIHKDWMVDTIVDTNDGARFPLQPPVIREGWLQLKRIKKDD